MKKLVCGAMMTFGALTAMQPAKADILFGVYGEAQYWFTDANGGYGDSAAFDAYDLENKEQLRLSVALHHPVPFLPNVRIETQDMKTTGQLDNGSTGELDLSHDSAIFYYTFLDNSLVRLHAGVAAKRFNGQVADAIGNSWNLSETIPTAYALVGAGLPFTGLSAYARGHVLAIDSSSLQDIEIALQYRLFDSLALDGSIQVGYRYFNVELDNVANLYSDVEFKGPFVGIQLHF